MTKSPAEKLARQERLVAQAKARMDAANARQLNAERKIATRRKIIIGSLLIDAAEKDPTWRGLFETLMRRVDREQDRKVFEGWTLTVDDERMTVPKPDRAPEPGLAVVASDRQLRAPQPAPLHAPFRWDSDTPA